MITKKSNYVAELEIVITETYTETNDNILKNYRDFRNFYIETFTIMNVIMKYNPIVINHLVFKKTVKTHKFENLEDIPVVKLKFRPITDQTAAFTYNAAKVILNYASLLCKNQYSIDSLIPLIRKDSQTYYLQFHLYKMAKM